MFIIGKSTCVDGFCVHVGHDFNNSALAFTSCLSYTLIQLLNFPVKPSEATVFFVGIFLTIISTSFADIELFNLSISSVSFGFLRLSRNFSISFNLFNFQALSY